MNDRLHILDTDILSLWQRNSQPECERIERYLKSLPPEQIAITVITVWEQFDSRIRQVNASYKKMRNTGKDSEFIRTCSYLGKTLESFIELNPNILPFNESAAAKLNSMEPRLKQKIGIADSCIAAIALSVDGVVVTRNMRDFSLVPGLMAVDWTKG